MTTATSNPTTASTTELAIPGAWDAKLILGFLENPAFEGFNNWITAELTALETKWQHASSPNAWQGKASIRGGSRG